MDDVGAGSRVTQLEQRMDALLRALPDIYFLLDAQGCILAFHAAREAEFHVPPERLIGQRAHDLLPPEVAPIIRDAVERVSTERAPTQIEYTLPTPSGDDQFEAYLVPCGTSEVTTIIRNTTARRRAEAALLASEERLRATQKLDAIGRLAGGVAHDFNNLLGVVLGRLTLLKRADGLADADREHLDEAFDAALHAASLTRQLLAFGRRQVMQPKVFDLNDVLLELEEMLRRVAGEGVEVVLDLSPFPCPVDSDPVHIEQVVLNLVINARHAMPDGGRVTISTRETWIGDSVAAEHDLEAGPGITLTVTDTGSGMTPDVVAHLFEPFFTTKQQGEGTGLGLATVYGIVKQSGGHTSVHTELGVGTTFEMVLPRAAAPPVPIETHDHAPSSQTAPKECEQPEGALVLVVEDSPGMRHLVVELLARAGHEVISASNAEDALRLVQEERDRLALVVADIVMPRMSGRTLAERIRELAPDLRILLMSGYERQGTQMAERFPLIEKPFTEDVFLDRVRDALNDRSAFARAPHNHNRSSP